MDNTQRLKNILAQLAANYRRDVTQADVSNFKMMLGQWGIEALEKAVAAHLFDPDDGKFFPNIANLAKHVTGTSKQQQQALESKSDLAWMEVYNSISRIGPYRNLELDDKVALAAVKNLGGWKSICMKTEQELVWLKKEFINAYQTFENTPLDRLPSKIQGIEDMENGKRNEGGNFAKIMSQMKERNGGEAIKHIANDISWAE